MAATTTANKYSYMTIHFGELWLKGRNRPAFLKQLYGNIEVALRGQKYKKLENARDRFVLHLDRRSDVGEIERRLSKVFGIAWFAPAVITTNRMTDVVKAARALPQKGDTIRIVAHRSFKGTQYNSADIVHWFITHQKSLRFKIDKGSERELYINVRRDNTVISMDRVLGAKGLPVGSSGRCVVLLSGGIDSPVASYSAMKKGLVPIYMHMHAFQTNEEAEKSKINTIFRKLGESSPYSKIYYLPSHLFQASVMGIPKRYELVLFKRFLYELAERIAKRENAEVIVTGEALAQVASQTVKNLIASEKSTEMFYMRPLIGMDKQEIIDSAKLIGTYDISVQEYPDVCAFRAQNPATAARRDVIDRLYKECKLGTALEKTLKAADAVEYRITK